MTLRTPRRPSLPSGKSLRALWIAFSRRRLGEDTRLGRALRRLSQCGRSRAALGLKTLEASPLWRRWGLRVSLAVVLATALAYLPYRILDGASARKAEDLRAQYQRTMERSRALERENASMRREITALKHDMGAILDIARTELGMVWPNEVILRMEETP